MSKKINIGVLGCANIAQRSILPAITQLGEQFNLLGIASRNFENAKINAQKFNILPFDGYQALLNVESLDAIYIPLPNALHAEWINSALDCGLHVLVEKSLACSKTEVEQISIKAKTNKLVVLECFQFRFHRQLQKIRNILSEGTIGDLRCIRSSFCFPPFSDKNNIRYQKKLGGGALLDAGAYTLKISQLLMGYDLSVKAAKLNYDKNLGVDIWGGGFIQQNNGTLFSEVAFGFDHFYQCNIELLGTLGKLYTNRLFTAPPGFEAELFLETNTDKKRITVEADNPFVNMLLHFYNLIEHPNLAADEYIQNNNQARLIEEFKNQI